MFETIYAFTLEHEGVYSNDPDDPGGETYKGISKKYHPDWEGWARIWYLKDKGLDWESDDILQGLVKEFYYQRYWKEMNAGAIVKVVSMAMFDTAVNCGRKRTIMWVQEAIGSMGYNIKIDGILGPITKGAINVCNPYRIIARLMTRRLRNYTKSKSNKKYLAGWVNRVSNLMDIL